MSGNPATAEMDLAGLLHGGARVLVVAPHPDDETLATGGLLQRAAQVGAALRVLLLTDGDNNPWPQRWLERRWSIDAAARRRWGERRRGESIRALSGIGLAADTIHALGWPDLGITARLVDDTAAAVASMAAAIADFRPTLLVRPALSDRHPDHGSAHVLVELALHDVAERPYCLDYLVHGAPPAGRSAVLHLAPQEVDAKRTAILAYATQVSLSRGRLLALATDAERYFEHDAMTPMPGLPLIPWPLSRAVEWLFVNSSHGWRVSDPVSTPTPDDALYAKPCSRLPSPWIFDHWGWYRLR